MAWRTLCIVVVAFFISFALTHKTPKFILETRHSWLKENNALLKLVDAKDALCHPNSSAAKLLGPIPDDLFETLVFDTNRAYKLTKWRDLKPMALDLLDCPRALQQCRNVHLDLYNPGSVSSSQAFSELLLEAMSKMKNLETIQWQGSSHISKSIANFTIPTVKELIFGAYNRLLLEHTPNVERLVGGQHKGPPLDANSGVISDLLDGASELKTLKDLSLNAYWSPELVDLIYFKTPQVNKLSMEGSILYRSKELYGADPRDAAMLKAVVAGLQKFSNLTSLKIPISEDLERVDGVGFPFCGNAYVGSSGVQMQRGIERARMWAVEMSSKIVLEQTPKLESLTVDGKTTVSIENGVSTWPWTGRMREYLWGKYPLYPGGYDLNGYEEPEEPGGTLFGSSLEQETEMLKADWKPGY